MTQTAPPTPPAIMRAANPIIGFLVRRNIGPLSKELMIITHTGRKSGRQYSTPIGYVREGDSILAFTLGGTSQWYKNIQQNPEVTLTIQGKPIPAHAEPINDVDEVAQVLDIYKREQPKRYEQFFGVPLGMPSAEAARSPNLRARYVRFRPVR
ncbi:MAG: nitroreductase family deazaflavin-dependent oxidoreductase [Chloroflexi bacterium]|nr:nitroreductase family deazaflavin-dependent oxidoreductase [Chloroflexota bacterium]